MRPSLAALRRRLTDRVRLLADEAWAQGDRELAGELHEAARRAEQRRRPWSREERVRRLGHS